MESKATSNGICSSAIIGIAFITSRVSKVIREPLRDIIIIEVITIRKLIES